FSSRRRHTRCLSDWSSDVCSSDLTVKRLIGEAGGVLRDNVVFTDRSGVLASFITTPRWLLTGKRDAVWGLPSAGIAEPDIAQAEIGRASCRERGEGEGGAEAVAK